MKLDTRTIVGGLLEAYRSGYFPMADPETGHVGWFSPAPRAVLPLEPGKFHVPRSLWRTLRRAPFVMTADVAFDTVTAECGRPTPGREETWINDQILLYYSLLHRAGHAHSIEAWVPAPGAANDSAGSQPRGPALVLVGGIYGLAIGGAFIAESMFCRPERGGTDASKVCLAHLVGHLRASGYSLLDVQIANPHTSRFGVVEIGRAAFRRQLAAATARRVMWNVFDSAAALAKLRDGHVDVRSD